MSWKITLTNARALVKYIYMYIHACTPQQKKSCRVADSVNVPTHALLYCLCVTCMYMYACACHVCITHVHVCVRLLSYKYWPGVERRILHKERREGELKQRGVDWWNYQPVVTSRRGLEISAQEEVLAEEWKMFVLEAFHQRAPYSQAAVVHTALLVFSSYGFQIPVILVSKLKDWFWGHWSCRVLLLWPTWPSPRPFLAGDHSHQTRPWGVSAVGAVVHSPWLSLWYVSQWPSVFSTDCPPTHGPFLVECYLPHEVVSPARWRLSPSSLGTVWAKSAACPIGPSSPTPERSFSERVWWSSFVVLGLNPVALSHSAMCPWVADSLPPTSPFYSEDQLMEPVDSSYKSLIRCHAHAFVYMTIVQTAYTYTCKLIPVVTSCCRHKTTIAP